MQEAAFELIETQLGLDARRIELYQSFGIIETKSNPHALTQMTNDELRELNKKRKIHQIAWVTRDLEKSMKAWVDNLKVGPWTVLTFTEKTLKYLDVDGKRVTEPFKFLIGIG
jgi:hypothetical protein